jgi:hypothetical protein
MPTYHKDDEYEDENDDELPPLRRNIGTRSVDKRPSVDAAQRRDKGYMSHPTSYRPYGAVPRTIHRTPYPEYSNPDWGAGNPTSAVRLISAVIGGVLLILAIVGFAWFWNYGQAPSLLPALTNIDRHSTGVPLLHFPTFGRAQGQIPTASTIEQVPALVAAGITLQHPTLTPALNQQQALLIASQLEPEAAANAQSTTSQFVLLDYTNRSNASAQPALNHVPAWMIVYQGIPQQPNDASADPKPNPQTSHNLYVFLNATTGKELLAIWV